MTTDFFNQVPPDSFSWMTAATQAGVIDRTLLSCRNLKSGSEITQEQFLLFRTICPQVKSFVQFNPASVGLNLTGARNILTNDEEFRNYIAVVGTDQWNNLTTFRTTLIQQWEVVQGFGNPKNPLMNHDETSVNSALMSFLQAVVSYDPNCRRMWRSRRVYLTANFGTVRSGNKRVSRQYVAITDDQGQQVAPPTIDAIAECKRGRRRNHQPAVDMQEVAQVVAWVKQYPDDDQNATAHQRVLFSKDGKDLFISFAKYDNNWANYIRHSRGVANAGLMTMQRFGPWRIDWPQEMRHFAEIALAIAMRQ